jgi:hypothetical protein
MTMIDDLIKVQVKRPDPYKGDDPFEQKIN